MLTGKQFNEIHAGVQFYGLEIAGPNMPLYGGGILFMKLDALLPHITKNKCVYLVTVPDDASVYEEQNTEEQNTFRADRLDLSELKSIDKLLKLVPHLKTEDLCWTVILQHGKALQYVPEPMKTYNMCLVAVKRDIVAMQYVPTAMLTHAFYVDLITVNGYTLPTFIPESMAYIKLPSMLLHEHYSYIRTALLLIPDAILTETICMAAVQQFGLCLEYVPEPMKTEEICLAAVRQLGTSLKYVPEPMKTADICRVAVLKNKTAFSYVPEHRITEELCKIFMDVHKGSISCIPESKRTEEMYITAVSEPLYDLYGRPYELHHVPDSKKTEAICLAAVKSRYCGLRTVPNRFKTEAVCLAAVEMNANKNRGNVFRGH